jgi:hypothetical protein
MWMKEGDIRENSRLLAGKVLFPSELQACKLPTLWIKAVDKEGPGILPDAGTCYCVWKLCCGTYREIRIQLAAISRARTATSPAAWIRPCLGPRGV